MSWAPSGIEIFSSSWNRSAGTHAIDASLKASRIYGKLRTISVKGFLVPESNDQRSLSANSLQQMNGRNSSALERTSSLGT